MPVARRRHRLLRPARLCQGGGMCPRPQFACPEEDRRFVQSGAMQDWVRGPDAPAPSAAHAAGGCSKQN